MAENRIVLVVEGTDRDDGHVALDVFLSELKKFNQALSRIDESAGQGQRNSHFAIVGLSHSSPATVEVEPRVTHGRQDMRRQVGASLARAIESVERGEARDDTDYELLVHLRGLAAPVGSTLKSVTLRIDGGSFELGQRLANKIDVVLEEHESCIGTIEGMLERINLHDEANMFTIYPDVGPKHLSCHFQRELLETAVAAIGKRVAVTGLMKFRKLTAFPHHITVNNIEIYEREEALPSFDDLRGIAPDATGDLSSEEFIARFRDGWV